MSLIKYRLYTQRIFSFFQIERRIFLYKYSMACKDAGESGKWKIEANQERNCGVENFQDSRTISGYGFLDSF